MSSGDTAALLPIVQAVQQQVVHSALAAPKYVSIRQASLSRSGPSIFSGHSVSDAALNGWYDFEGLYISMADLLRVATGSRQFVVITSPLNEIVQRFSHFTVAHFKAMIQLYNIPCKRTVSTRSALLQILASATVSIPALFLFGSRPKMRVSLKRSAPLVEHVAKRVRLTSPALPQLPDTTPSLNPSIKFPVVPSEQLKMDIIREFQDALSKSNMLRRVCAICAELAFPDAIRLVDPTKEPVRFNILQNKGLPLEVLPQSYNLRAYQYAILHPKGLTRTTEVGKFMCCHPCYRAFVIRQTLPPFALANWMYYAHDVLPAGVRTAFTTASPFDKLLIARGRTTRIIYKFTQGVSQPTAQGYNRGNVVVLPQDSSKFSDILPPAPEEVSKAVCALFVGGEAPTWDTIKTLSPVLVSKKNVNILLSFLTNRNPAYKTVLYSQERLDSLFDSPQNPDDMGADLDIPCHGITIEHLLRTHPDQPVDVTSGYAERHGSDTEDPHEDLLMESVGYIEGDHSRASTIEMKLQALNWCKSGKRFLRVSSGSTPLIDREPQLLTWLFPHLDPFGIGGFLDPRRAVKVSMVRQLEHLLKMADSPFAHDPSFAFVFYNIVQKANVNQNTQFIVKSSAQSEILSDIASISLEEIQALQARLEKNPRADLRTYEEHKVMKILRRLHVIGKSLPGSGGAKLKMRNEIRALMAAYGIPSFFITLNPADTYHPIVRLLANEDVAPECLMKGDELSSMQRMLLVARNPLAGALFFDTMIRNFIRNILRYGREGADDGLYGKCIAYYGTVETTGRGTLHCHMLIWLQGSLGPTDLRLRLQKDPVFKKRMFDYLESCIFSHLPGTTIRESADPSQVIKPARSPGQVDPRLLPPPTVGETHGKGTVDDAFKKQFDGRVSELAIACNWHQHSHTCWKKLKANQSQTDANCRLRMTGMTRDQTTIDDVTGSILLRRLHPWLANYNPVVIYCMECNNEHKFIGSGPEALATAYYITGYITKDGLPAHVGLSALIQAIRKGNMARPQQDNPISEEAVGKKFLTRAVNALLGRQEVSHQQIMHYLTGGNDYYTSHLFVVLHWSAFRKVLRLVGPYALSDITPTSTSEITEVPEIFEAMDQNGDEWPSAAEGVQPSVAVDFLIRLEGNEPSVCSQVDDYCFRSHDPTYNNLCLYDFVSSTKKDTLTRDKYRLAEPSSRFNTNQPTRRGEFTEGHPQKTTHQLRLRSIAVVPVILGPRLARPDRGCDECERWCFEMLALFKPWRNVGDLKEAYSSWFEAFDNFIVTPEKERLMSCMCSLNECKDAKDQYELARWQGTTDGLASVQPCGSDFDRGTVSLEAQVSEMVVIADNRWDQTQRLLDDDDRVNRIVDPNSILPLFVGCITAQQGAGLTINVNQPGGSDVCGWDSHQPAMAALQKLRRPQRLAAEPEQSPSGYRAREPDTSIARLEEKAIELAPKKSVEDIVKAIVVAHSLAANEEQMMAYTLIANHLVRKESNQLLMYVSGVGGTGKSHVINAVVELFEHLGDADALMLTAYTGIAATLIGGFTCHSLLFLSDVQRKGRVNIEELQRLWRPVRYLILDEVSLISASFLFTISYRLTLAKSCAQPFGGVHVIFMGDFGQLKPIAKCCLFSHSLVGALKSSIVEQREGQESLQGIHLWRQVSQVVELKTNMRSRSDPAYANLIARVRQGIAWQGHAAHTVEQARDGQNYADTDYNVIRSRLVSSVMVSDPENFREFKNAPFIVPLKAERDALNFFVARSIAKDLGIAIHCYLSVDRTKHERLTDRHKALAWDLRSTITKDSLGRLPLMPGMRAMVTENLAVSKRLVNGTEVVVKDILYRVGEDGARHACCVLVYAPGVNLDLPGLESGVVPIYPRTTRFSGAEVGLVDAQIIRDQIPLIPAYAFTDYKSQGRTLTRAIVDLSTSRSLQSVYVMLSRVKSLRGLLILRDFPMSKVNGRLSEEFRSEFVRLGKLVRDTKETSSCNTPNVIDQ